jgi:ABC-2 type transport system permease protein
MMLAVLQKECREILRDGRFVVLMVGFLVLLAGVTASSFQHHQRIAEEKAVVEGVTRAQWEQQGDKHPHRGAHFGIYALRPDSALAAFDPGLGPHIGQALWLEPHHRNMMRFDPAADALPHVRLAQMSPAFVLTALLPLLVIALGFSSISRERESGTLRMLHGSGLSARWLLAGKAAALLVVAGSLVALAMIASFALTWWNGAGTADALKRFALIGVSGLAYIAIFVLLTLAVSCRVRSSRTALFVLLAIWLAWTFVVPRLGAATAASATELPTPDEFWQAIRHDYTEGLPGDGPLGTRVKHFEQATLRRYGVSRFEDLPIGINALRRLFRDAYADRVHAVHFDALWQRYETQRMTLQWMGLASPAVAMRSLSMAFSGTDLAHQRSFEEVAERYRQKVNRQIDEWDAEYTQGVASYDDRYAGRSLWQAVEPFSPRSPDVAFAVRNALADMAVLGIWLTAILMLLVSSARKLQP